MSSIELHCSLLKAGLKMALWRFNPTFFHLAAKINSCKVKIFNPLNLNRIIIRNGVHRGAFTAILAM